MLDGQMCYNVSSCMYVTCIPWLNYSKSKRQGECPLLCNSCRMNSWPFAILPNASCGISLVVNDYCMPIHSRSTKEYIGHFPSLLTLVQWHRQGGACGFICMEAEKGNFYVSAMRRRTSAAKQTPSARNFAAELCTPPRRDKDSTPVASLSAIN